MNTIPKKLTMRKVAMEYCERKPKNKKSKSAYVKIKLNADHLNQLDKQAQQKV